MAPVAVVQLLTIHDLPPLKGAKPSDEHSLHADLTLHIEGDFSLQIEREYASGKEREVVAVLKGESRAELETFTAFLNWNVSQMAKMYDAQRAVADGKGSPAAA